MKARIYIPSKSAMQSGRAHNDEWVLEFDTPTSQRPEPLMGWTQSDNTLSQLKLKFTSKEMAIKYAEEKGIIFTLIEPKPRKVKPRNYTDNFRYTPPKPTQKANPQPSEKKRETKKSKGQPKADKAAS
ncbi:MAG: ETC complex I subunit [Micavibrio sp.]|nr:ETC complex I subunit [Micavibrio sp.]